MNRDFKGIWIPKEIWLADDLTVMEKLFLVEIDSLDNARGCFATNAYFADFFGLSESQVSRIIGQLILKERIVSQIDQKNGNQRTLRVYAKMRRGYTQKCVEGIRKNAEHNNTVNNTINSLSDNDKKKTKSESALNQAIPINKDAFAELERYLDAIKATYKTPDIPKKQKWIPIIERAVNHGMSAKVLTKALGELLADTSRQFEISPQNVYDRALMDMVTNNTQAQGLTSIADCPECQGAGFIFGEGKAVKCNHTILKQTFSTV